MNARSLTLVLVTDGPARAAAPVLAERFAHVRCEAGAVLVGVSGTETAEAVLAWCRQQRIDVVASCLVSRTTAPPPAPPAPPALPDAA